MASESPVEAVAQRTAPRLVFVDALRGLAVGSVVLFHAGIWSGLAGVPMRMLSVGHLGVDLFFVISGFCMVWPLALRGPRLEIDARRFIANRARRIVPPYYAAITLAIGVSAAMYLLGGRTWWHQPFQDIFPIRSNFVTDLAAHLVFAHGFSDAFSHSIDGAFWSLATEWQFYLLFPILLIGARRLGPMSLAMLGILVSGLILVALRVVDREALSNTAINGSILVRFCEFAAGMAVAKHIASGRRSVSLSAKALPLFVVLAVAWTAVELARPNWFLLPVGWAAVFGGLVFIASGVLQEYRSSLLRSVDSAIARIWFTVPSS